MALIKPPKAIKVAPNIKNKSPNVFPTTVGLEDRRVTGVGKALLKAYKDSPARYIPRSRELTLKGMMGGNKKL